MPVSVFRRVFVCSAKEPWIFQGIETMRIWIARAVFVAVVGFAVSAMAADWPHFRGPNSNGISPETGISKAWNDKKPETLWTAKMSDDGCAGPSIAGGKVFIIDHVAGKDFVRCFELATGKQVWEFPYDEAGASDNGFARSTPTVEDGVVYTVARSGQLFCLDVKDGKKIWGRNLIADFKGKLPQWKMAMSPVIDGDKLIVCPGGPGAGVAALNKKTGETIWQGGGDDKIGYATPVIATIGGKKQYLVFTGVSIIGVDAADGKVLWSHPWKTQYDVNAAAPILVGDDSVYITSGYGHGCALMKVTGEKPEAVWENKEIQAHFSSSILIDGFIYGTGDPGNLVCLEAKTGKTVWRQGGFEKGGIIAVDGTLIGLDGKDGNVIMVEISSAAYKELGRFKPLGGQSWTAAVVADGKMLVRNKTALACFNLK